MQNRKLLCHPPVAFAPLDPFGHHRITHRDDLNLTLAGDGQAPMATLAIKRIAPALARFDFLRPPQVQIQRKIRLVVIESILG
jgi:hypothetical protein